MKSLLLFTLLILSQLSCAQMFPWQPNEVILNERDTFVLVERIDFDANNRLRSLTNYEFDNRGVTVHKTQLDGQTKAFYEEISIREDDSKLQQTRYRIFKREHQDSVKRLEYLSCFDEKNRLLWKHTYDYSGEVIDSLMNMYDEHGLVGQNTWNSSLDWSRTQRHEQIGRMRVIYTDSGEFHTTTFIMKTHYQNGMESKSSSTTTYQYDLNRNLIEECYYWDDPGASNEVQTIGGKELSPVVSNRAADDTLHKIILREYDLNDNLIYASYFNSLDAEPFQQEHYKFDKKGRLIKSYQINAEGIHTGITLVEYRKRGNDTEITSTKIADKFTGELQSVSLVDISGRFLKCVTYYDCMKASTDEWSYQQNGHQYQVQLKQYFSQLDDGDSEFVLTRWVYAKK
jgi:hypothetical protein